MSTLSLTTSLTVISRTEAIRNTIVAFSIIGLALLWRFYCDNRFALAKRYIYRLANKTYFCGYTLKQICQQRLLKNLGNFTGQELSGICALLMMTTLRGHPASRLVRCWFDDGDGEGEYQHYWVEFRFLGVWYTFDPYWYYGEIVIERKRLDHHANTRDDEVYSYDKFWALLFAKQLYCKVQNPDTSYLFHELYDIAQKEHYEEVPKFSDRQGCEFLPYWFTGSQIVSRGIFDFMIQSANYRAPSGDLIITAINEESYACFKMPRGGSSDYE